jgi:hypothetical protein
MRLTSHHATCSSVTVVNSHNTPTLQRMLLASPLGTIQSEKRRKQGSSCSALQCTPAAASSPTVTGEVQTAGSVQLELVVTLYGLMIPAGW